MCRVLNFLHEFQSRPGWRVISQEMCKDLQWWKKFMNQFNGVTMFPESKWYAPDQLLSTDSCLSDCGGWLQGEFFHCEFPMEILSLVGSSIAINELECPAVVVALKAWQQKLPNRNILLHYDNSTTVQVINNGAARNAFTQACLREIAWVTATNNAWIKMVYLPGNLNRFSDLLSHWHCDPKFEQTFRKETRNLRIKEIVIPQSFFCFTHDW